MLNDFMMQGYMDAHPEEKGDVLYIIAESYYRQEQYQTAAEYYRDALETVPDSSLYLRDYMAALTRSGEVPDIDALQQQYPEAVLDPAEGSFIEAESAFASGDMEEALAKADAAMDLSTDSDLTAAVCDLKADICVGLGGMEMRSARSARRRISAGTEISCGRQGRRHLTQAMKPHLM